MPAHRTRAAPGASNNPPCHTSHLRSTTRAAAVDAETLARLAETPQAGAGEVDSTAAERSATRSEERRRIMAANLKKVPEAGIAVAMGTDAGNPLTVQGPSIYAEMEAMAAADPTTSVANLRQVRYVVRAGVVRAQEELRAPSK
jgi:hypothetical protein